MTDQIPLSLAEATEDETLKGAPLHVYAWLWRKLEPHGYRPVSVADAAKRLRMKRGTVGRALRLLLRGGYLAEGKRDGPYRTFRVLKTRNSEHVPLNGQRRAS